MATKFKNGITSEASLTLPYTTVTGSITLDSSHYTVGCNSVYTITALSTTSTQWVFTANGHGMVAGTIVNVSGLTVSSGIVNGPFVITAADANTFTVDSAYPLGTTSNTGLAGKAYGSFTVTLPTAVGIQGRVYNIKNLADGIISVSTSLSQTLDGSTNPYSLENSYHSITIQSTGSNWIIL